MKKTQVILLLLLAFNFANGQSKMYTHDSLLLENKVYLLKSTRLPFTGTAISANNGIKVIETQYVEGKVDGFEILYYNNGNIETKSTYKEGKFNGLMTSYYSDGSLKSEEFYQDDFKNGKSTYYYPFQRIEKEGYYENCIETGVWTFWDENGKKTAEIEYKNGEIIKEIKF